MQLAFPTVNILHNHSTIIKNNKWTFGQDFEGNYGFYLDFPRLLTNVLFACLFQVRIPRCNLLSCFLILLQIGSSFQSFLNMSWIWRFWRTRKYPATWVCPMTMPFSLHQYISLLIKFLLFTSQLIQVSGQILWDYANIPSLLNLLLFVLTTISGAFLACSNHY